MFGFGGMASRLPVIALVRCRRGFVMAGLDPAIHENTVLSGIRF